MLARARGQPPCLAGLPLACALAVRSRRGCRALLWGSRACGTAALAVEAGNWPCFSRARDAPQAEPLHLYPSGSWRRNAPPLLGALFGEASEASTRMDGCGTKPDASQERLDSGCKRRRRRAATASQTWAASSKARYIRQLARWPFTRTARRSPRNQRATHGRRCTTSALPRPQLINK